MESSQMILEMTPLRWNTPLKLLDESIAAMTTDKLKDGDVIKGSVLMVYSDDRLVATNIATVATLSV